MEHVYVQNWMALPKETRDHLVKVFNLNRSGASEIRDQDIITDGYTNTDLLGITHTKMAEYTASGADVSFHRLWEITLSKVKYELSPELVQIGNPPGEGRTVAEADVAAIADGSKKFCQFCEAKGPVKHMGSCTRPQ